MDAILVISGDLDERERLKSALQARGFWVVAVGDRQSALRAAADQAPRAVILDGELEDASDLVNTFGSRNGGPGALVLSPETSSPDSFNFLEVGADELLRRSVAAGDLVEAVTRVSTLPRTQPLRRVENPGRILSTEEIFGDLLAEMNGGGGEEDEQRSRQEALQIISEEWTATEESVRVGGEVPARRAVEPWPDAAAPALAAHEPTPSGESLDHLFAEAEEGSGPEPIEWPELEAEEPPEPIELPELQAVEPPEPEPLEWPKLEAEEPPEPEPLEWPEPEAAELSEPEPGESEEPPAPKPTLPALIPAAAEEAAEVTVQRRRWLLPAGLAAVLLAGAGLALLFRPVSPSPALDPAPPPRAAVPAVATPPRAEAPGIAESGVESAAALAGVDLETLVDRELERREAALREAFLEEERRLLRELDRLERREVAAAERPDPSEWP